jgi:hypothetical protein
MFGFLGTSFKRNQQPTARQAARPPTRFCLEELESRALPSVSPAQALSMSIQTEMVAIRADVQAILIPYANLTVRMDVGNLYKDVNAISADLAAGRDATSDVKAARAADAQLSAALGSNYSQYIRTKVTDIGNRLAVVANDLSQPQMATHASVTASRWR